MTGGPELNREAANSPLEDAQILAQQLNELKATQNEIPDEFIQSLQQSDPSLFNEFQLIEAEDGLDAAEKAILNEIDTILGYEAAEREIPQALAAQPIWTEAEAAPYRNADGTPKEGYSWADRTNDGGNWKLVPDGEHVDADNDGVVDGLYNDLPEVEVGADIEIEEVPPTDDAPTDASTGDVGTPSAETAPDTPEAPRKTTAEMRSDLLSNITNYIEMDGDSAFTIKGMDRNATLVSRINDFYGPDSTVKQVEDPTKFRLKSNEKNYTWNTEQKTWIEEGKISYEDRLKVLNGTRVTVESIETAAPAAPVEEEGAAPAAPEGTPGEAEAPATAPEATATAPSQVEVQNEPSRLERSRTFTDNLQSLQREMSQLMKQYDKVFKMDTRDREHQDRYARELTELKSMHAKAGENLSKLTTEFAGLKTDGIYPVDVPSTEQRTEIIDDMTSDHRDVEFMIRVELESGEDPYSRLPKLEQRDRQLDAEWTNDVMPRINTVVAAVDSKMSISNEDVTSRGPRGNNKTVHIRYTDGESVQTSVKAVKINLTQLQVDDTYERQDNISIHYRGESYPNIDAAVKRAAEDFKTALESKKAPAEVTPVAAPAPVVEASVPTAPAPTPEPAVETPVIATPEPLPAPTPAPEPVAPVAATAAPTEPADPVAAETVEAPATDTVELRWTKRQQVFDDLASLPSNQILDGRAAPLPEGWNPVIEFSSGNKYKQKVEDGYVTARQVQLGGTGDWYEIPYVNHIEQGKEGAYQAIENADPTGRDRSVYRPERGSDAIKDRYKIGALVLKKAKEEGA